MRSAWYAVALLMLTTVVPGLNVAPTALAKESDVCDASAKYEVVCVNECFNMCAIRCAPPGCRIEEALPPLPPLCPGTAGAVEVDVCISAPFDTIDVLLPEATIPPDVPIKGYVDRYSFFGGSLLLPCIVVEEPESVNPCGVAGGVFLNRVLQIIDKSAGVPDVALFGESIIVVPVCHYKVTALALGFGLNDFPLDAPCA